MTESVDVVLIGGGIMSATLGTLLHELQPDWKI
ncbi:MAG: malate:quinone oxidoreductase, partial [Microbacterium sp.]